MAKTFVFTGISCRVEGEMMVKFLLACASACADAHAANCIKFCWQRSSKQTSLATETVFCTKPMYLGKFFFH